MKIKKVLVTQEEINSRLLIKGTVYNIPFISFCYLIEEGKVIIEVYRAGKNKFVPMDSQATKMVQWAITETIGWDHKVGNSPITKMELDCRLQQAKIPNSSVNSLRSMDSSRTQQSAQS